VSFVILLLFEVQHLHRRTNLRNSRLIQALSLECAQNSVLFGEYPDDDKDDKWLRVTQTEYKVKLEKKQAKSARHKSTADRQHYSDSETLI
jgi:hypothetical protein